MHDSNIEIIHKDKMGNLLFAGSHKELSDLTKCHSMPASWVKDIDKSKTQMMVCGKMIFVNDKETEIPAWLQRKIKADEEKQQERKK